MDFSIVPMQTRHIAALAELETRCFSDPWPAAAFASELENPLSLWLVAECSGAVAGYVGSQIVPDEADMMNLAVSPEFRRQGLGRALTLALFDALRERGVVSLTLEVRDSNTAAITLYESLGFCQIGLRKKYYFHPTEDARILKKELNK